MKQKPIKHETRDVKKYIRTGDDPILKQVCTPIVPGEHLPWLKLLKDVCMKARNPAAAGLAAPQIGHARRVIVLNKAWTPYVMINPQIISEVGMMTAVEEEQCLSYPGKKKIIARFTYILVMYLDEMRCYQSRRFFDFDARVIQHEIDHLNGICRVGDDSPNDKE